VSDRQTSLGHRLDQVAIRELVAQVPAYTKNDDLLLERLGMLGKARHFRRPASLHQSP
jgi:hypothetical protein